jgi:hypothetical protein
MHGSDEFREAVLDLQKVGLDVQQCTYGFSLAHRDSAGTYDGECGPEHDFSVSLAITVNCPPVKWFFRFSVREMAEFLVASYAGVQNGRFPSLAAAMAHIDDAYDYDELWRRLKTAYPDWPPSKRPWWKFW